jgi:hypothetical protein
MRGGDRCMSSAEHLDEREMIEILEDLARHSGSATARIQAIKTLREMSKDDRPAPSVFEGLYEVGKAQKSKRAA